MALASVVSFAAWPIPAQEIAPPAQQADAQPTVTGEPLKILFFGSSYTYYNDMPGMLRRLAESRRPPLAVSDEMEAHPGYSLDLHWRDEQARDHLGTQPWDVVVLQEQSQAPLGKKQRMLDHARLLSEKAGAGGARIVLFMTWAPLRRPAMIEPLAAAYEDVGRAIGAQVAPVGRAWQRALEKRAGLRLHSPDGSHPGPLGSYLAACVLYATILGEDPRGLSALDLVDEGQADAETIAFLQEIAWQVTLGKSGGAGAAP